MRTLISFVVSAWMLVGCSAPAQKTAAHPSMVIGVDEAQLQPEFWIRRLSNADRTVLDAQAIAAQNERLHRLDHSFHDIERLPQALTAAQVRGWIENLSARPDEPMYDVQGQALDAPTLDKLVRSTNLNSIPQNLPTRYGLVVRRADLRTFPTRFRAFTSNDDTDIDRFQESAIFPGTPVAIVHESEDRAWWFVVSPLYAAWVEKSYVAQGTAQQVFTYAHKTPYLVITGAKARTVFTPERPEVSELQLEMGARVPLLANWPASQAVNGQHSYSSYVIELPLRGADGSLSFTPALLPKTNDTAPDYLPLSRANLLHQSFKFLGERYGWGHSYNARDCSGFVSEVYRSFGVQLPRNTRDQGVTPAVDRISFSPQDTHAARLAALRDVQVGDLIYIPGHVMMVIGQDHGMPYVIHDTVGIAYRAADDSMVHVPLNGVSVTPLTPLLLGKGQPMVDRIYSILRMRPGKTS